MKQEFDLTKPFCLKGDWYLPDDRDNRLSGEVTYTPNEGVRLEIIGDFKGDVLGIQGNYYPTILGIVEGSRDVSLFGCNYISRGQVSLVRGSEMAKPVMTFAVNEMLDGWHFNTREEILAKTVYVEIDGLDEWLHITGFNFKDLIIDPKACTVDLHYKLPETVSFEFPAGCNAAFVFSISNLSQPVYRTFFEMRQKVVLKIEKEEGLHIDDIYRVIYEFQSFMILCCSSNEPFIKRVYFCNPDYSVPLSNDSKCNRKVSLYNHQHFTIKENKWDNMFMMVTYSMIKDKFPELILKWSTLFKAFEPAINLLVEQIRDKKYFNDNDFLNLAQAAETIHDRINPGAMKMPKDDYKALKTKVLDSVPEDSREFVAGLLQYGNNVSFAKRIGELVASCPNTIVDAFIPDKDSFIYEVRDSRNYYTHYTLLDKKYVKREYGLLRLSERLQMLLVVVMLLHVGVDRDLLEKKIVDTKAFYSYLFESPE